MDSGFPGRLREGRLLPHRVLSRALVAIAFLVVIATSAMAQGANPLWLVSDGGPLDTPLRGSIPEWLSGDGRFLLLNTTSTQVIDGLVDFDSRPDLYLVDRVTDSVRLVTHAPTDELLTAGSLAGPSPSNTRFSASTDSSNAFVSFWSNLPNLAAGQEDSNDALDLFLWNRASGDITLVSRVEGSNATAGDGNVTSGSISANGRFLVFVSDSSNLLPDLADSNGSEDVFLYDRETAELRLISRSATNPGVVANGTSRFASVSSGGERVYFSSDATDLVPGVTDLNGTFDAFVWEEATDSIFLLSRSFGDLSTAADGESYPSGASSDGRFVALRSTAISLVSGTTDANSGFDAFFLDRQTNAASLASRSSSEPSSSGNGATQPIRLSADGRYLLMSSLATNLVAGIADGNNGSDIFLWDRDDGSVRLVSKSTSVPASTSFGRSELAQLSSDGAWVYFRSLAEDLVEGGSDPNSGNDWFLWSRDSGTSQLVSHAEGTPNETGNQGTLEGVLSADGTTASFGTHATNHVAVGRDANQTVDSIAWSRNSSHASFGLPRDPGVRSAWPSKNPRIDDLGKFVAFDGYVNVGQLGFDVERVDVYRRERESGETVLISHAAGQPLVPADERLSVAVAISSAGDAVVLDSLASNLVSEQDDSNAVSDVFLWSADGGESRLVSHVPGNPQRTGDRRSLARTISRDGRFVLFESESTNLIGAQVEGNDSRDVFVWDRENGAISLVSHRWSQPAATGDAESAAVAISATGEYVLFNSKASDLTPQSPSTANFNVYLWRRSDGQIRLVSHRFDSAEATADGESRGAMLSDSGQWVAFDSMATNLVDLPTLSTTSRQVYRFDAFTGTNELLTASDPKGTYGNGDSWARGLSADGATALIASAATNILDGLVDGAGTSDLFLWSASESDLRLVTRSQDSDSSTANQPTLEGVLDRSGMRVAYTSEASDLDLSILDTPTPSPDVFSWFRADGSNRMISRSARSPDSSAGAWSSSPAISGSGDFVTFLSASSQLVAADYPIFSNAEGSIFLWFSGLFVDGFEAGSTIHWSQEQP